MTAHVIWLTGISGSGKTTLTERISKLLRQRGHKVETLDGDVVRSFFENDLGYSRPERILNVRRIAFAAMLLAKNDVNVVVANIAPYYEARDFIRQHLPNYIQIYLKTSIEKASERDTKGVYTDANHKNAPQIIGVGDAYEAPRRPDLIVETDWNTIDESVETIMQFLILKGFRHVRT